MRMDRASSQWSRGAIVVLWAAAGVLTAPRLHAQDALMVQDTLMVQANNPPVWGESPRLVEEMRVGTAAGEEAYSLGYVVGVVPTGDGGVWVLDGMNHVLRRYDSNGVHLTSVGRKGHGPREFEHVTGITRTDDGLAVYDPGNSRISLFESTGEFRGTIRTPNRGIIGGDPTLLYHDGSLHIMDFRVEPRTAFWLRLAEDPTIPPDTVYYHPPSDLVGSYHPTRTTSTAGPSIGFVEGRNDAYTLRLTGSTRPALIQRPHTPVAYKRAEKKEAQTFEELYADRRGKPARRMPTHKPVFQDLRLDQDDRIWVFRYVEGEQLRQKSEEITNEFFGGSTPTGVWGQPVVADVISITGEFLGTLTFPSSASNIRRRTRLANADDLTVWTIEKGEFDEEYVVRYRIEPSR